MKYINNYTFRWDPGLVLAENALEHNMLSQEETEQMVEELARLLDVEPPPVWFSRRPTRPAYYDDEKHIIVFRPPVSEAAVLHEFAHYVQDLNPPDGLKDAHGPVFCKYFRRVLEAWGIEVPRFEPYIPPRFTRQFAIEQITAVLPEKYVGFTFEGIARPHPHARQVFIESAGDRLVYTFALCTEGNSPYYKWVLCREYKQKPDESVCPFLSRVFREEDLP